MSGLYNIHCVEFNSSNRTSNWEKKKNSQMQMLRQQSSGRRLLMKVLSLLPPLTEHRQPSGAHQLLSLALFWLRRQTAASEEATVEPGMLGCSEDCFLATHRGSDPVVFGSNQTHLFSRTCLSRPVSLPSLLAIASRAGSLKDTCVCLWQHWVCR